jgi:zinc/manganese transport system ATP-binding protein
LQRALFARVLVQNADIILLDEPFNAIDGNTVGELIGVIKRWHSEQLTVMVVAHDLELVRANFPETLLLARGPIAWGETAAALSPENLLKARRFDEAWHDDAPWCQPTELDHVHGGHARLEPAGHVHGKDHSHAGPDNGAERISIQA